MLKLIAPLLVLLLLISFFCFSQEKSNFIVINKQVEVVEYDYKYVFIELSSSLHFSIYYPILTSGEISESQHFFEQGRNIRPGFDIGLSQTVKTGNWALTAGLSYHQYNDLFSYNEYSTRQITLQNQDGSLQTITVTDGDPITYSQNNSLGYLKIPIGLSFYPNHFRNKLGINLSVNYHYLMSTDYMTKYSNVQAAGLIPIEVFNSTYLSLTGSLLFHKKIFRNLSLTLEPYFDWGLNNLIDQKDLTFGIKEIGINSGFTLFY
jgi:hypothetical protein